MRGTTGPQVLASLLAVALLAGVALAQVTAPPASPAPARRTVRIIGNVDYSGATNSARFTGSGGKPVTVITTEGTLTAREMTVHFTPRSNNPTRIEASGNVTLDADYTGTDQVRRLVKASGERATYDLEARKVVLDGNVRGTLREPARDRVVDLTSAQAALYLREDRIVLTQVEMVFEEPAPAKPVPAAPATAAPPSPPAAAPGQ